MAKHQLLFGRNILVEALQKGADVFSVYCEKEAEKKWALELFKARKLPLPKMMMGIPNAIRESGHQGIAFETNYSFYLNHWDAGRDSFPFILLCNHLEDVQNLGGVARSAAAFGVNLIVHEERRSVRLTPTAVKISAGQAFHTNFLEVANLQPFCQYLKKSGYMIVGLDMASQENAQRSLSLYHFRPEFPLALVLGAEGTGLSKPVKNECEFLIQIPMQPEVESLNATTAASIAMSWIHSQILKTAS